MPQDGAPHAQHRRDRPALLAGMLLRLLGLVTAPLLRPPVYTALDRVTDEPDPSIEADIAMHVQHRDGPFPLLQSGLQ